MTTEPLIHWYDDNSSLAYYYIVYAAQSTIDKTFNKIKYHPYYFEHAKEFSDNGQVVVVVFNKNNVKYYKTYIYNSSKDEYWSNKIILSTNIDYDERYDIVLCMCHDNNTQVTIIL